MKVLIVEDEAKAAAYLKKGLEENGFVADIAEDGETGAYLARGGSYDLLILDVMLPGQDGWSVLRELRERRAMACPTGCEDWNSAPTTTS